MTLHMRRFYLLGITFIVALGGCHAESKNPYPVGPFVACPDTITMYRENTVRFCGTLNELTKRDIIQALEEQTHKDRFLMLDMTGGVTADAHELALYIREKNITLLINDICLSSCSQILLLAAKKIYFREHSIVGMHDTQYATNIIYGRQINSGLAEEAQHEIDFYNQIGISLDILEYPMRQLEHSCIINSDTFLEENALRTKGKFDYYMPSDTVFLRWYRGNIMSGYPDLSKAKAYLKNTNLGQKVDVKFGEGTANKLEALPDCP